MPGHLADERQPREEALRQTCERMGWSVELGRKVFKAFADALREVRARHEREAELMALAEKRKARKRT
jgi:hypothetical protein